MWNATRKLDSSTPVMPTHDTGTSHVCTPECAFRGTSESRTMQCVESGLLHVCSSECDYVKPSPLGLVCTLTKLVFRGTTVGAAVGGTVLGAGVAGDANDAKQSRKRTQARLVAKAGHCRSGEPFLSLESLLAEMGSTSGAVAGAGSSTAPGARPHPKASSGAVATAPFAPKLPSTPNFAEVVISSCSQQLQPMSSMHRKLAAMAHSGSSPKKRTAGMGASSKHALELDIAATGSNKRQRQTDDTGSGVKSRPNGVDEGALGAGAGASGAGASAGIGIGAGRSTDAANPTTKTLNLARSRALSVADVLSKPVVAHAAFVVLKAISSHEHLATTTTLMMSNVLTRTKDQFLAWTWQRKGNAGTRSSALALAPVSSMRPGVGSGIALATALPTQSLAPLAIADLVAAYKACLLAQVAQRGVWATPPSRAWLEALADLVADNYVAYSDAQRVQQSTAGRSASNLSPLSVRDFTLACLRVFKLGFTTTTKVTVHPVLGLEFLASVYLNPNNTNPVLMGIQQHSASRHVNGFLRHFSTARVEFPLVTLYDHPK